MDKGKLIYLQDEEITIQFFIRYALDFHKEGKEGQTTIVLDECQRYFNCREFGRKDRNDWVTFFSMHRHLGYNIIMITQNDKLIDKQIRAMVEYEIKHRKLNGNGFGGTLLMFTGMKWFIAIETWYGVRMKLGQTMFSYRKKYGQIYDSYRKFNEILGADGGGEDPRSGGDLREVGSGPKANYEGIINRQAKPPVCSTGVQFAETPIFVTEDPKEVLTAP